MVFSPLGFLINLLMAFGCMAMGREAVDELSPDDGLTTRWAVTWGMGAVHAAVHVVAVFSLEFFMHQAVSLWAGLGSRDQSLGLILHSLLVGLGVFAGGAMLGSALFGGYLALMCRLGLLTNNGYSALDGQDHKGFLRFRIDAAGALTAHFIAIDRVPRRWRRSSQPGPVWRNDDAAATAPRLHDRFRL
jgi:hypothetical protein